MDFNLPSAVGSAFNAFKNIGSNIEDTIGNAASAFGQSLQNEYQQQIQPAIQQGINNFTGNLADLSVPYFAEQFPQTTEDVTRNIVNQVGQTGILGPIGTNPVTRDFLGRTVGGLEKGFAQGVTAPLTNKPLIEKVGDVASGVGAIGYPLQSAEMGVINPVLTTAGDLLQRKLPTGEELGESYSQGLQMGTQLGPLSDIAAPFLTPLTARLAPEGLTGVGSVLRPALAQGITGGVGMGAYGAMLPATNTQGRLQNALSNFIQGFALSAGGSLLASGFKGVNRIMQPDDVIETPNGMKIKKSGIDYYAQVKPQIDANDEEYRTDPQVWGKLMPQDSYEDWYKTMDMNHSLKGSETLKNAKGYFAMVDPNSIPKHAEDSTGVFDERPISQFVKNNGLMDLPVIRQTYDETGNPNAPVITDGHHRFPLAKEFSVTRIPAVILDNTKGLLSDAFYQAKNNPQAGEIALGAVVGGGGKQAPAASLPIEEAGRSIKYNSALQAEHVGASKATVDAIRNADLSKAKSLDDIQNKLLRTLTSEEKNNRDITSSITNWTDNWKNSLLQFRNNKFTQTALGITPLSEEGKILTKMQEKGVNALSPTEQDTLNKTFMTRIKTLQQQVNPQAVAENFLGIPLSRMVGQGGQSGRVNFNAKVGPTIVGKNGKSVSLFGVNQAVENAKTAAPDAVAVAQDAADTVGGRVQLRIKNRGGLADKVLSDRGRTLANNPDTLATTVIAQDKKGINQALDQIKQDPRVQTVLKDKIRTNPDTGYEARHLQVKLQNGQTEEVQGHTETSAALREQGHAKYKGGEQAPLTGQGPGETGGKTPAPPFIGGQATIKDAESLRFATMQNIEQRARIAQDAVNRGVHGADETELFRQAIEHPQTLPKALQQVSDPQRFQNALTAHNNFFDYAHNLATQNGMDMGHIKNYYTHIVDLSDPAKAKQFETLLAQRRISNYSPFFTKERIFNDINQMRAAGFDLKNPTVSQDIQDYANAARLGIGNQAFLAKLQQAAPGEVQQLSHGIPMDAEGKPFNQFKAPGLQNWGASQRVYDSVKNEIEPMDMNRITKIGDDLNTGIKQWKLALGGFHPINITTSAIGNEVANLHVPRLDEGAAAFMSPHFMANYRANALDNGTIDKASIMNVFLSRNPDVQQMGAETMLGAIPVGKMGKAAQKFSPIDRLNNAIFDRLTDFYKLEAVKHANVDLSTPEGVRSAQKIGAQINDMFSGPNRAVGDSIFRSKLSQLFARTVALAPSYQEGRFHQTISAIRAPLTGNPADWYAARATIGKIAATAVLAEAGNYVFNHKLDTNLKDLYQNAFLNPGFKLPWQSPQGKQQFGTLPASNPSDVVRILTDPEYRAHFPISHLGAGLSELYQGVTGKDYYGHDLVDPFQQPDTPLNRVKALIPSSLPIAGVQAIRAQPINQFLQPYAQQFGIPIGKPEDVRSALLNVAGLRVGTAKTDPSVIYATSVDKMLQGLNPNDQAAWHTLHPQSKDSSGNSVRDANLYTKYDRAQTYLAHMNLFEIDAKLQKDIATKTGGKYDPLYDLPADKAKTVLQMRTFYPGENRDMKAAIIQGNPWYKDFVKKETDFYNSLPLEQKMGQLPRANVTPQFQQELDYYNSLPSGTGDRARFLASHQEVIDYWNQLDTITNAERADLGLPLLQGGTAGGTSTRRGTSSSGSLTGNYTEDYLMRALMRRDLIMQDTRVPLQFRLLGQEGLRQMAVPIQLPSAKVTPIKGLKTAIRRTAPKTGGIPYQLPSELPSGMTAGRREAGVVR